MTPGGLRAIISPKPRRVMRHGAICICGSPIPPLKLLGRDETTMIDATTLTLVRHGESRWNLEGRLQGHLDSSLTATGIAQAEATGRRLVGQRFTALYSSDLGRAHQTAEIISEHVKLPVVPMQGLRERNLGVFQGLTWEEVERKYPQELRLYGMSAPDYVIPDGESVQQRYDRTVGCLEQIARAHLGGSVIAVTHFGALESLLQRTMTIPLEEPRHFNLWNGSLNVFFYEDETWILGTWGDVAHLAGIGALDEGD